jgi:hypothetical protein
MYASCDCAPGFSLIVREEGERDWNGGYSVFRG